MKIMHIITGLGDGGAEGTLYRLCTHDPANQHIVVSFMDEGKYGRLLRAYGITVHCLMMPRGRLSLTGLIRLGRLIRQLRPNVVQTWMYHADLIGGLTARLAGNCPVVWGIRHSELSPDTSRRTTIWIARCCALLSPAIPSRIVACAQKAAQTHRDLGYQNKKISTIPNGCDLNRFKPDPSAGEVLRETWQTGPHDKVIGIVARFAPEKDHANLFSAIKTLLTKRKDLVFVFAGSGMTDDNPILTQMIRHAGIAKKLRLLGGHRDIPTLMNAIDLHLLSSSSEAFPNVLAEAMACGTPCVTTDVGDAAEIVGDTGWVVPPRTPSALANATESALKAIEDDAGWQARKLAARNRIVQRFGIERMVQGYNKVWQEAASEFASNH